MLQTLLYIWIGVSCPQALTTRGSQNREKDKSMSQIVSWPLGLLNERVHLPLHILLDILLPKPSRLFLVQVGQALMVRFQRFLLLHADTLHSFGLVSEAGVGSSLRAEACAVKLFRVRLLVLKGAFGAGLFRRGLTDEDSD